jgi:hypothetical protein
MTGQVDLNGIAWSRVDWDKLVQEREDWHTIVKKKIKVRVTKMGGIRSLTDKLLILF